MTTPSHLTTKPSNQLTDLSRRDMLKTSAGLLALGYFSAGRALRFPSAPPRIVVVGAGAFGGWTALHLLRMGAKVTLVDAWGPGHSRASSGGETRIIRATYGGRRHYYPLVARSLELWQESQKRWNRPLYKRTGLIWLCGDDDRYELATLPMLKEFGFVHERVEKAEAAKRWPQINFEDVPWLIYEREAGYLLARRACAAVMEAFVAEGGEYRQAKATPGVIEGGEMKGVTLGTGASTTSPSPEGRGVRGEVKRPGGQALKDSLTVAGGRADDVRVEIGTGEELKPDQIVFALGPWLGKVFPGVVTIRPTRQELFYFGTPAGDARFQEGTTPAWIDSGRDGFYGIPGNEYRGFKVADDNWGPVVDPETQERLPSPMGAQLAREYLTRRFPAMKDAPLVGAEVCQYEVSPDGAYVADRHPLAQNVWLVGGGSGHGFKNGPAFGEYVAQIVLGKKPVDPVFGLGRFKK